MVKVDLSQLDVAAVGCSSLEAFVTGLVDLSLPLFSKYIQQLNVVINITTACSGVLRMIYLQPGFIVLISYIKPFFISASIPLFLFNCKTGLVTFYNSRRIIHYFDTWLFAWLI